MLELLAPPRRLRRPTLRQILSLSTPFKNQASMIPEPIILSPFTINMGGDGTGASASMWAEWSWAAFTIYFADGSTVSVPSNTGLSAPAAPTLAQVAGGALGARAYFVRVGYVKNGVVMGVSSEVSLAVSANNLLKVTGPASGPAGYDGWCVLVGTSASGERFQTGWSSGAPAVPAAFGATITEPTVGATTTAGTPGAPFDASMATRPTFATLVASTAYFAYPFWDMLNAVVAFGDITTNTPYGIGKSPVAAQTQHGDSHVPLSVGGVTFTTPAASTTSNTTGGGGNFI
jgi:hypothetical protein